MRVIIADDSRPSRDVMRRIMRDGGHEVVACAGNGQEAIDLCREHKPHAVILDLSMPVMPGNDAAAIIISEALADRVIITSSMSQTSIVNGLKASGCKVFTKPYEEAEILEALR